MSNEKNNPLEEENVEIMIESDSKEELKGNNFNLNLGLLKIEINFDGIINKLINRD